MVAALTAPASGRATLLLPVVAAWARPLARQARPLASGSPRLVRGQFDADRLMRALSEHEITNLRPRQPLHG